MISASERKKDNLEVCFFVYVMNIINLNVQNNELTKYEMTSNIVTNVLFKR